MKSIIHVYPRFSNLGGAQKVLLQIRKILPGKVASFDKFDQIEEKYNISKEDFFKLNVLSLLRTNNTLVISHHRKITTIFIILNKIFSRNNKIIHVAHNEFSTLKWFTFFPSNIIAVSERVKANLVSYFDVNEKNITVIYNGLGDVSRRENKNRRNNDVVKVIYAARINSVKQQVLIADMLNRLKLEGLHVYFAGIGPQLDELMTRCGTYCSYIGVVNDVFLTFHDYDYLMLFSKNEGLPLSIIEAQRSGLPVICNDVGGNTEIITNEANGFIVKDEVELERLLIRLSNGSDFEYVSKTINSRVNYESRFKEGIMLDKYKNYIERLI